MRSVTLIILALAMAGSTAANAQAPAAVVVHLSNFKFSPPTIVMDHGKSYVLRLVNDGGSGHSFSAKSFFAAAQMKDRAAVSGGKVELPGDAVREVELVAPVAGTYEVKCTHFLHSSFGMTGSIVVR